MAQYIKNVLAYAYERNRDVKLTDGNFTLLNKFSATVDMVINKFTANVESSTDFQFTGINTEVFTTDTVTDYSGYNKKYINEDGTYNFEAALAEFGSLPTGRKLGKEEIQSAVKATVGADSHESFIYNMLVSWLMARLYVDTGSSDKVLKIKQTGLIDTHVNQTWFNNPATTIEIKLGPPNPSAETIEINFRNSSNYWTLPYVLRYPAENINQTTFYMAHTLGREGKSLLNVDIPIEGIDTSQLLFDPLGGYQHMMNDFNNVPWNKPDIIWQWIIEYVRLNRLEHAFAASFELLGSLCVQPIGTFHESIFWHGMVTNVHLAKFQPTRARIRTNLDGEPFARSTMAHEFMVDTTSQPSHYITDAAVYNYAFMLATPAILNAASNAYDNPFDVFYGGHEYMDVFKSQFAKTAVVSSLFEKEMPTNANPAAYTTYTFGGLVNPQIDLQYIDKSATSVVSLQTIPPYLSGGLLMGSVSLETSLTRHLKQHHSIKIDNKLLLNPEEALKLATMYRCFGYDTPISRMWSNVSFITYAGSHDWIVSALPFDQYTTEGDLLKIDDPIRRDGVGTQLPSIHAVRGHTITTSYTMPTIDVVQMKGRKTPLVTRLILKKPETNITFRVKAANSFIKQITTRSMDIKPVQGFQQARTDPAPSIPVENASVTTTLTEKTGQEESVVHAE